MKRRLFLIALVTVTLTGTLLAWGPARDSGSAYLGDHEAFLSSLPEEPLSSAERAALAYMAEEEKLARDVYRELYDMWGLPTFDRIAESEQQHIDSVMSLLSRYELPIPRTMETVGDFDDPELAALYGELLAEGRSSLEAAVRVGATIEDLDIADLQERIAVVDNADIIAVFENLLKGSENHLRAFSRQMERLREAYEPVHISVAEYESILDASQGRRGRR